jgi:hypothetical protein
METVNSSMKDDGTVMRKNESGKVDYVAPFLRKKNQILHVGKTTL